MLSTVLNDAIKPRQRLLTTMWGAFMAATVIYVFVSWMVTRNPTAATAGATATPLDRNLVSAVLAVLSVALAAASYVYPRYAFSAGRLVQAPRRGAGLGNARDPGAIEAQAAAHLPESERALLKYLPAYQSTLIVVWAMREAIAVLGVILALLTREFTIALPFAGAALVLLAMARPQTAAFLDSMWSRRLV